MKKRLVLALMLAVVGFALVACGGTGVGESAREWGDRRVKIEDNDYSGVFEEVFMLYNAYGVTVEVFVDSGDVHVEVINIETGVVAFEGRNPSRHMVFHVNTDGEHTIRITSENHTGTVYLSW